MDREVNEFVQLFLNILHMFSIIEKKPWDFGTGSKIYLAEIQTVAAIGENPETNMTQLAEMMGVTRGAISQIVRKLVNKKLVVRTNARNQKEINLGLTDFGMTVRTAYQSRMKEVFTFADELYALASPAERELVRRLFLQIQRNMKNRIT
jgi:DNA-binding MarR family transcriptional regulator